eukprot:1200976-Prymnesium_polylepis.4
MTSRGPFCSPPLLLGRQGLWRRRCKSHSTARSSLQWLAHPDALGAHGRRSDTLLLGGAWCQQESGSVVRPAAPVVWSARRLVFAVCTAVTRPRSTSARAAGSRTRRIRLARGGAGGARGHATPG